MIFCLFNTEARKGPLSQSKTSCSSGYPGWWLRAHLHDVSGAWNMVPCFTWWHKCGLKLFTTVTLPGLRSFISACKTKQRASRFLSKGHWAITELSHNFNRISVIYFRCIWMTFPSVWLWLFDDVMLFQVPFSRSELHGITENLIHFVMYEYHTASFLERVWKIYDLAQQAVSYGLKQCDSIFKNEQLMATLRDTAFDAVLLDPMIMCGDLLADILGLPLVISLRFSIGGVLERHCGHVPAPPSFVPPPPLPYSDRMTFTERLTSAVTYVSASAMSELFWRWSLDNYYSQIKGWSSSRIVNLKQIFLENIRPSFLSEQEVRLEFVRLWGKPTSGSWERSGTWNPHVRWCPTSNTWAVYTANQPVLCQRHKSTPFARQLTFHRFPWWRTFWRCHLFQELEAFVESSGEAGVIVVTFGSMVTHLSSERAEVLAAAFGRMPQKVRLIPTVDSARGD